MGNAGRIATDITADEYALGDTEAIEQITAIVRRGGEDALDQIADILTESGRDPSVATMDDLPPGYDPDTGEFEDYDEGDPLDTMRELDLIEACLSDILKPRSQSA